MSAPTGTQYPGGLDTSTTIGTAVGSGGTIASAYGNTQSSAILAIETALGPNPGGKDWKQHVRLASAAALPANTYSSGAQTLTATSNGALSVDGTAVNVNDRLLVKNEATATHNGIYTVTNAGGASAAYVLTRAADYNSSSLLTSASLVAASEGTANANTAWVLTNPAPITLDSTSLAYAELAGGTYTAGTGLTLTSNQFSLTTPVSAANGGTGLSSYTKGDIPVATGSSALTNVGVGTNNQTIVADSTQTAGVRWANTMFGPVNPYLPNAKFRRFQTLNSGSGNVDFGFPPSGKRWLVIGIRVYNASASGITINPHIKNGGTYYAVANAITAGASSFSALTMTSFPVLESSDTLGVFTGASSLNVDAHVLEFDTTSTLKTVKVFSLSSGDNTLYTCPTGMSACLLQATSTVGTSAFYGLVADTACGTGYGNVSGATRTIYWNSVVSGGSPVAPGTTGSNAISGSYTVANQTIQNTLTSSSAGTSFGGCLGAGDFINLHTDAATATQYAWVTVIEWTT